MFDPDTPDPTFRFRRTDTDETVQVTYHVGDVPDGGSAIGDLQGTLEGSAGAGQFGVTTEARHRRAQAILSDDSLFTAETV